MVLVEIEIAFSDLATAYDKFQDDRVNVSLLMQGSAQPGSVLLANYMIDAIASVERMLSHSLHQKMRL
jgi:hypothetical protein